MKILPYALACCLLLMATLGIGQRTSGPSRASAMAVDSPMPTRAPRQIIAAPNAAFPGVDENQQDVTAAPTDSVMAPVRLVIRKLGVDTVIESLGILPDGTMEAPRSWNEAGWFSLGYRPGELGNAVIAGHLDSDTGRALFWDLNKLQPADVVSIYHEDGSFVDFSVTAQQSYRADSAPLGAIFGPASRADLNLITCDGTFNREQKAYDSRLVVYTRELDSPGLSLARFHV